MIHNNVLKHDDRVSLSAIQSPFCTNLIQLGNCKNIGIYVIHLTRLDDFQGNDVRELNFHVLGVNPFTLIKVSNCN